MDAFLFSSQLLEELNGNLLPFWRQRSVDTDQGGFVGEMDFAGRVAAGVNRGLILHARLLWTFSALFRMTGHARDRQLAERAHTDLQDCFFDSDRGGYYWEVNADGQAVDQLKRVYGQAFCIYALSEYYLAFQQVTDRDAAIHLFDLIEKHALDVEFGGYFEVCHVDWSVAGTERLSDKDQAAPKSMNNHLHLLEAYTNLHRIWPDARLGQAVRQLIDVFGRHILNADRTHQRHFFRQDWRSCSSGYTYGHDIEAAWLLCEAAAVLEDPKLSKTVGSWALSLATAVLQEGLEEDGSVMYEGGDGRVTDRGREWWPQAEAVVGFLQVYRLTGNSVFLDAAAGVWQFIQRRIVDRQHGEWHWRIRPDGQADPTRPKISAWKGPYHNVRMCLEGLRRLDSIENDEL